MRNHPCNSGPAGIRWADFGSTVWLVAVDVVAAMGYRGNILSPEGLASLLAQTVPAAAVKTVKPTDHPNLKDIPGESVTLISRDAFKSWVLTAGPYGTPMVGYEDIIREVNGYRYAVVEQA